MAGTGLFPIVPHNLFGAIAPGNRVNIGVIGLGFGITNMRHMINGSSWVHCVALCDVDQNKLETFLGLWGRRTIWKLITTWLMNTRIIGSTQHSRNLEINYFSNHFAKWIIASRTVLV